MKKPNGQRWVELAKKELGGADPETLVRSIGDCVAGRPLYFREDVPSTSADAVPGEFPFLRGPRATMYTVRPWTIRQYAGFSTAAESNAFYRAALAAGQTGLSVAFDLPTHRGYDSDHLRVASDVGKAGVAVDSVEDMKILFEGIPLGKVSVSMTMNGAVLPVMASFIVAAEEQGVPIERLTGTIQNDILKEFIVRNTYIYPPGPSMRIVADVMAFISRRMPKFNSVSVSGYHMHEAGATADLELAFTLGNGLEYVRAACTRGLSVDDVAPRMSFFFAIGMNVFLEIAKLRAARTLWANLMKKHFRPSKPESMMLRTHCQTSGVSLTAQDPYNNIVRTTLEAFAAVCGGTQSLHTNAFDEALALPGEFASRIARNTQLILEAETGVTSVVDPLGGSYYVEALTEGLAARALCILEEVEAAGGMTKAVERGTPKRMIEEAAARQQARIDAGDHVVVGVNKYNTDDPTHVEARVVDNAAVREVQIERLRRLRQTRSADRVESALRAVANVAASGTGNLLEAVVEASRARATVGEISTVLEGFFTRYRAETTTIAGTYGSYNEDNAAWIGLRRRIERFAERAGRRPRMLVVKMGQDGHDRGAKVIASSFADLGFAVDVGPLFQTPAEAARQAVENDVHVVGVSTQAGAHNELVPALIAELSNMGADDIAVVCGGVIPPADHASLLQAGVRVVFEPGMPIMEAAAKVLDVIRLRESAAVA